MRHYILAVLLVLSGCATRSSLLDTAFVSSVDFEHRLRAKWSLADIQHCDTPERLIDNTIQAPVALMNCNRSGRLYEGINTRFDVIEWHALVIKGQVKGYSLVARRGKQSWALVRTVAAGVPFNLLTLRNVVDK